MQFQTLFMSLTVSAAPARRDQQDVQAPAITALVKSHKPFCFRLAVAEQSLTAVTQLL